MERIKKAQALRNSSFNDWLHGFQEDYGDYLRNPIIQKLRNKAEQRNATRPLRTSSGYSSRPLCLLPDFPLRNQTPSPTESTV